MTKENTALLVMDAQVAIISPLTDADAAIAQIAKAINYAHEKKIPVIYVTVGFREGAPEISMNNKFFAASKERFAKMSTDDFTKIHPDIAPKDGDIILIKRRVSAFTGGDLEVILRAQNIQHMVLTGFSTSGVVLSTVREASDKDYQITVLSDGCGDRDAEVHQGLMYKIFPKQADVITTDEWLK